MSYTIDFRAAPDCTPGRENHQIEYITIHYWGDLGQTHKGVVNFFASGPGTSAHEVISAGRVTQMVDADDTAWSNGNWPSNLVSYSLECRPEMSPADIATVAQRIAALWTQWGRIVPLRPHDDFTSTSCPGPWKAQIPAIYTQAIDIYTNKTKETLMATLKEMINWRDRNKRNIVDQGHYVGEQLAAINKAIAQSNQIQTEILGELKKK